MRLLGLATPVREMAIIFLCFITICTAKANTLDSTDRVPAEQIGGQLLQLMRDIGSAARAASVRSQECLINMQSDVERIFNTFTQIQDLVYISTNMHTRIDEMVVNNVLANDLKYANSILINSRDSINLSAGYCGHDSLVNEKGRQALSLFSQGRSIIGDLALKLGRSK